MIKKHDASTRKNKKFRWHRIWNMTTDTDEGGGQEWQEYQCNWKLTVHRRNRWRKLHGSNVRHHCKHTEETVFDLQFGRSVGIEISSWKALCKYCRDSGVLREMRSSWFCPSHWSKYFSFPKKNYIWMVSIVASQFVVTFAMMGSEYENRSDEKRRSSWLSTRVTSFSP